MTTLSPELERSLRDLANGWPALDVLMVFGSAARGQLGASSDLDLFVRLAHGSALDPEAVERFRAGAERVTRREIDLIIERPQTSVLLRREVASEGQVLFERIPGRARQLVVDAIRDYVDLEPYLRKIGSAIRARAIAEGETAKRRLAGVKTDGG